MPPVRVPLSLPPPEPVFETVSRYLVLAKEAITVRAWLIVTLQVGADPLQALQWSRCEFESGCAVRVTSVPESYLCEQVEPQLIPPGALVTVPEPHPYRVTCSVYFAVAAAGVATPT